MIREVNLISYLPSVIANIKDIDIAMAAEGREFMLIWQTADRVLRNEFIALTDENGIAEFEKILHIRPLADDTLEIRRARVQTEWFAALPYTWKMFVQKIMEICGTNYPASIIRAESYLIKLEAGIELQWQIESLMNVVEKMLPCNMGIAIKNVLPIDLETSAPTIRPDWFGYGIEYRGEINADENILLIKTVCMHALMPFWGGETYNGRRRYDGTMRYNAKRNYVLCLKMKNILQLYTEQVVRYAAVVFKGHIRHKADVDMFLIQTVYMHILMPFWGGGTYNGRQRYDGTMGYNAKRNYVLRVTTDIHTGLKSPSGDVGNMSIESKRNVVRHNGTRRYNGTTKYNALYRKEQIE